MSKRVTINLSDEADSALDDAFNFTGDHQTAAINKALKLYAVYLDARANGGGFLLKADSAAVPERIIIL